jgi:hypothetical protein
MEDNIEDHIAESSGFKKRCKKTLSKLMNAREESSHSKSPSPRRLSVNLTSSHEREKSPSDRSGEGIIDRNIERNIEREKTMQKRSISVDTYVGKPMIPIRSKTASPRIIIKSSHEIDMYACFIIYVIDGIIRISGANYNTLDLVQSGYRGIKINDHTLEEDGKYFLVYSKSSFGIYDTLFLSDRMGEDEVIREFSKNFPIIIKCVGQKFAEEAFMGEFLSIMFSIKEQKDISIEEKEKIIESSEESHRKEKKVEFLGVKEEI